MNELENFLLFIKSVKEMEEEELQTQRVDVLLGDFETYASDSEMNQFVNQMIQNFEAQELSKQEAAEAVEITKQGINELIYDKEYTGNKKVILDKIVDKMFRTFDMAVEKYHSYSIELPMVVDTAGGAKVPTYAHDTDAAADLYAMETVVLEGHTRGNKIHTGIKIQLPEGWLALVLPRSSMGTKTPLRLSNSVGLIDSGYRGELIALYDNISDDAYEISAGDRIAQLLVMPSYRFQPKVVDILADSDRGEGGFGSSGN